MCTHSHGSTPFRIDRNGTKYFRVVTGCPRCGGTGKTIYHPDGGVCYRCGGSGDPGYSIVVKEYTPEYQAKLAEAARKRREASMKAEREYFIKRHGLGEDGAIYVAWGVRFSDREKLRSLGGRWSQDLYRWWFASRPDDPDVRTERVEFEDYTEYNGKWYAFSAIASAAAMNDIAGMEKAWFEDNSIGGHVGTVGKREVFSLTYEKSVSYQVESFGWRGGYDVMYIHMFKGPNGESVKWKTATSLDYDAGARVSVKATVKEHGRYKGTDETVVTRCVFEDA